MKKITIDEMKQHIISVLPDNVTLIDFSYDAKCFGNIIAQIKKRGKTHTFIADRGEIWHNKTVLCDSSYQCREKEDTFSKLLQMISKEMNK